MYSWIWMDPSWIWMDPGWIWMDPSWIWMDPSWIWVDPSWIWIPPLQPVVLERFRCGASRARSRDAGRRREQRAYATSYAVSEEGYG
jgi:hypothetical protein